MNLLANKVGLKIKYITGEWSELYNKAINKKLDIMLNIAKTKERERFLLFTDQYQKNESGIFSRKNDSSIIDIESLDGKKVAIIEDFILEDILKKRYPLIKSVITNNISQSIKALESGKVDAIIGSYIVINHVSRELLANNIERKAPFEKDSNLHIAIRKDYPLLQSILQKAMEKVTPKEIQTIRNKWILQKSNKNNFLNLSKKERDWLKTKPIIKFAVDPSWLPMESINKKTGKYEGIAADIIKKIENISRIQFTLVPTKKWSESIYFAKQNSVDMLAAISITPERKKYMNFSNTIFSLNDGVIMKNNSTFITSLSGLKGLKIGVAEGTSLHKMLREKYPSLILVPIKGTEKSLDQLRKDEIDAYVGNLEAASHIIFQKNFFNLKVVFKLDKTRKLHIGLHKNVSAEALSIINKSIKTISEDELKIIRQRWIGLKINEKIDYSIFYKIAIAVLILILFFVYWNRKLKQIVEEKTSEIKILLKSFDKNVIASRTDLDGKITYISEAFSKISGYKEKELIGKQYKLSHRIDMDSKQFLHLWKTIKSDRTWYGEIKLIKKDGNLNWVDAVIESYYNKEGKKIGYSAIYHDITAKKEVEELSGNLELKVEERTSELKESQKQSESILSSVLLPMLITSKNTRKIVYANEFAEKQYETTMRELIGLDIDKLYTSEHQKENILKELNSEGKVTNFESKFKTLKENKFDALLSLVDIKYGGEDCYLGVASDITEQKKRELLFQELHKHIKESIEYASLIQHALIPEPKSFDKYFNDYFTLWQPKDIVGGDIYLFEQLRGDHECLLMVIDCTGHGVPGAFVTMLVKAIERQVISKIVNNEDMEVSPAWILQYFNKSMKRLLKQEDSDSVSNAGFDGAILYYNKNQKVLRFAGAETPLFYTENNELNIIKGDRHSIGYKKSDINYEFKEHVIEIKEDMKFYITTDGFLDQNGGEKGFPFGKNRFKEIINESKNKSFNKQKEIFHSKLLEYQNNAERNDDITLIGLEFKT